ncbi:MAG TPA: sigma-70 family RNA polymerase sigma factor [Tepidisphaeraceae bacterium]|jgi:DNA-directed RNA polymerase specialized sigma24 family protein
MPISPDILAAARKLKPAAVSALLREEYPMVYRMARGLTGRDDAARSVVRFVVRQGLHAMPRWQDETAPHRWFQHHTVLTARRTRRHEPDAQRDVLVSHATAPDPAYVAFVRALRHLPIQQKEAFILAQGERLDTRQLAIAMDCSTEAAANHLIAARQALLSVAGDTVGALSDRVAAAYARLQAPEELVIPSVQSYVRRYISLARLGRAALWILVLAVVGFIALVAWEMRNAIHI